MNAVRYSIRDVEKLTGIKAHTIRMWEKRYDVVQPERTDTNIRFYTDRDLKKLLNICVLNKNGFKISQISEMSESGIQDKILEISEQNKLVDADVNSMMMAAIELQEDHFDQVLNACLLKFGFERTFCDVIFPLFEKVSLMWQIGRINACQERFITNLVRQKLLVAIDGLVGGPTQKAGTFLLFMPAGHDMEIGLLFSNYLIRKNGYNVVYLGPSVPFDHLKRLASPDKFEHLFVATSLTISSSDLSKYLRQLRTVFLNQDIHIATPLNNHFDLSKGFAKTHLYADYMELGRFLEHTL